MPIEKSQLIKAAKLKRTVAVVVCTHNRPVALDRCLKRLRQINDPDFLVVVVDSAPNSFEAKMIAAHHGAKYILSPVKGLSRARNLGTQASNADIIAYLDDDMIPHADWLKSLIAEFADVNVMAATGPVLPLEFVGKSDVDLALGVSVVPWGSHRFQIDRSSRQWFVRTNFGGVGDGNFALRRSAYDYIRGFDERLGRGATIDISEEHYAYFMIVDGGFTIAYAPQAMVFHPSAVINRRRLRKQISDTVAFGVFLAWNHPPKSWRIVQFMFEGVFRARRWWHLSPKREVVSVSTMERIACGAKGLAIFCRSLKSPHKPPLF